jgi:hypothetical protein
MTVEKVFLGYWPFCKLTVNPNGKNINASKMFPAKDALSVDAYFSTCFDFAYRMTFGLDGSHRDHRSGGIHNRKMGEVFANTLQGKLSEFGMRDMFSSLGQQVSQPCTEVWGKGRWDSFDLVLNNKHISIKSTTHFGNLLLLEAEDFDEHARYLPNRINGGVAKPEFHVLTRIAPDCKSILKSKRWLYTDCVDRSLLFEFLQQSNWLMDCPGYINDADLMFLISNHFRINRGDKLNGRINMDADNYYCQSGNLRPISQLIEDCIT